MMESAIFWNGPQRLVSLSRKKRKCVKERTGKETECGSSENNGGENDSNDSHGQT